MRLKESAPVARRIRLGWLTINVLETPLYTCFFSFYLAPVLFCFVFVFVFFFFEPRCVIVKDCEPKAKLGFTFFALYSSFPV